MDLPDRDLLHEDLPREASLVTGPSPEPVPEKRHKLIGFSFLVRDLALAIILAAIVILFLYRPVKVEGTSMMPGLEDQERIFINQFVYRFTGSISRSDTIVFWFPLDTSKSYIKRVVGLPGDRVRIDAGRVYVNGQALDEPYVPLEYRDRQSMPELVIPETRYFVLGDHRSSSNDSRSWGTVPRDNIFGKAVFVYWPLDKMGALH
ncbi:MAG TPA: signal peptidase I [Bryobacteraceae bacterium]|jgi:signal peptidase I